jgi:FemAB family protein
MIMQKKLFKIIYNYFPEADTDVDRWHEVIKTSGNNSSTFHLLNSVKYYVTYFSENNSINLSMVLYDNQKAVGILPLMAHKNKKNEWVLSSNGIEIVEPIFKISLGEKVKKKLESKILDLIFDLSRELKINKCQFTNMDLFRLSKWYIKLLELSEESFTTYHCLIDLSLSIEDIRLQFRKSFKSLVNKGLREWNVQVQDNITQEQFEKFILFHKSVVGRSTRSIESWNIQKQQVDSNEAFIITVTDKKGLLVGAGLFTYSKNLARYSVGVYKLEYDSIGHVAQMKAIETLKTKGIDWYEMGSKYLNTDKISPTEKELSISFFLEGFATNVMARQHLLINIPSNINNS